jgi:hypothetical protein
MRYVVERSLVLKKRTIVEVDIQDIVVGVGELIHTPVVVGELIHTPVVVGELIQPTFIKVQS